MFKNIIIAGVVVVLILVGISLFKGCGTAKTVPAVSTGTVATQ
jgi:hypothetical protein